jgi:lysylphosphatidylglycerol synthetase-like protein (DUF2156 family)
MNKLRVAAALARGNEGVLLRILFVKAHVAHRTVVRALLTALSYSLLSFDGVIRVFCAMRERKRKRDKQTEQNAFIITQKK